MRPLGKNQLHALDVMRSHPAYSVWFPGCGWVLGTDSQTDKIMASLVKRELVARTNENHLGSGYGRYALKGEGDA